MRQRFAFAALVAAVLCAAPALAQCQKSGEKSKSCSSKGQSPACCQGKTTCTAQQVAASGAQAKSATCSSDVTCDGDVVRYQGAELPRIGFKVGDANTCCMKSANEMAAGDAAKIKFVVGEKTYDNLGQAKSARLKALKAYYEDILTVGYAVGGECTGCPMTAQDLAKKSGKPMQYRLASFDFAEKPHAEQAAKAARAAGEKVTMSWAVGEKAFDCPVDATDAAKTCGKNVEYCVGDQKTPCETTAKTRLIEARIAVVLKSLAEAAQG